MKTASQRLFLLLCALTWWTVNSRADVPACDRSWAAPLAPQGLEGWTPQDPYEMDLSRHPTGLVTTGGFSDDVYVGKLSWERLMPDYTVLKVTQPDGVEHYIDAGKIESVYRAPESGLKGKEKLQKSLSKHRLNEEHLRRKWCEVMRQQRETPEGNRLQHIAENNHDRILRQRGMLECVGSLGLTGLARHSDAPDFVQSMALMGSLHQCISALGNLPGDQPHSRPVLGAAVVTGSAIANHSEGAGSSEWAGLAGYALAAVIYEKKFGLIPVAKWCR